MSVTDLNQHAGQSLCRPAFFMQKVPVRNPGKDDDCIMSKALLSVMSWISYTEVEREE